MTRRRKWQPTPEFLPGELYAQRSLAGYNPWGYKESDTTEWPILSLPWHSKLSPIWPQPANSSTTKPSSPAKTCPTMHASSPLNHKGQLAFPKYIHALSHLLSWVPVHPPPLFLEDHSFFLLLGKTLFIFLKGLVDIFPYLWRLS